MKNLFKVKIPSVIKDYIMKNKGCYLEITYSLVFTNTLMKVINVSSAEPMKEGFSAIYNKDLERNFIAWLNGENNVE